MASTHDKIQPLPGGLYDDSDATKRSNNAVGKMPDFGAYGPSLGKMPAAGSYIGLCFYPKINNALPGYAVVEHVHPTTGVRTKSRVLMTDHPDGG